MRAGLALFAFDGSEAAEGALEAAGALNARRAVVACVWQQHLDPSMGLPVGAGMPPIDVSEAARRAAEHGAATLRSAGFEVEAVAVPVEESVTSALLDLAERRGVTVIVVGARDHSHVSELLGTTTQDLIRRASCPVLVVRERRQGR